MIHFNNLTRTRIDTAALMALGKRILEEEGIWAIEEVGCNFTDDAQIQQLNLQYRGVDSPTDVLAFSFTEGEAASFRRELFGDIVISVETAQKNAKIYGQDLAAEIRLLFVHGLLHLLGYRDENEKERMVMRAKEHRYLEE
jgi:probable rRNA maturation factor